MPIPTTERIEAAAATIASARLNGRRLDLLPLQGRPRDEAEAYAVQGRLHQLLTAGGRGARIGHKIGCTTPVMQDYLGIRTPCAGGVFADEVHRVSAALSADDFRTVGVECEIAVELSADLTEPRIYSRADAERAVASAMPAIEVVDDRYTDWRRFDTPTLIADDFFAAGCVLGAPRPLADLPDLASVRGRTRINGEEAGAGIGSDVMGHPLSALAWLATHRARIGKPLRRGEFVLTGSLVQTRWLKPGDAVAVEIEDLGAVRLTLT